MIHFVSFFRSRDGITDFFGYFYHVETIITEADYVDYLALLANSYTQAKSLPHRLKQLARGIVCYINTDKTELINFNQAAISLLNGKPKNLILVWFSFMAFQPLFII